MKKTARKSIWTGKPEVVGLIDQLVTTNLLPDNEDADMNRSYNGDFQGGRSRGHFSQRRGRPNWRGNEWRHYSDSSPSPEWEKTFYLEKEVYQNRYNRFSNERDDQREYSRNKDHRYSNDNRDFKSNSRNREKRDYEYEKQRDRNYRDRESYKPKGHESSKRHTRDEDRYSYKHSDRKHEESRKQCNRKKIESETPSASNIEIKDVKKRKPEDKENHCVKDESKHNVPDSESEVSHSSVSCGSQNRPVKNPSSDDNVKKRRCERHCTRHQSENKKQKQDDAKVDCDTITGILSDEVGRNEPPKIDSVKTIANSFEKMEESVLDTHDDKSNAERLTYGVSVSNKKMLSSNATNDVYFKKNTPRVSLCLKKNAADSDSSSQSYREKTGSSVNIATPNNKLQKNATSVKPNIFESFHSFKPENMGSSNKSIWDVHPTNVKGTEAKEIVETTTVPTTIIQSNKVELSKDTEAVKSDQIKLQVVKRTQSVNSETMYNNENERLLVSKGTSNVECERDADRKEADDTSTCKKRRQSVNDGKKSEENNNKKVSIRDKITEKKTLYNSVSKSTELITTDDKVNHKNIDDNICSIKKSVVKHSITKTRAEKQKSKQASTEKQKSTKPASSENHKTKPASVEKQVSNLVTIQVIESNNDEPIKDKEIVKCDQAKPEVVNKRKSHIEITSNNENERHQISKRTASTEGKPTADKKQHDDTTNSKKKLRQLGHVNSHGSKMISLQSDTKPDIKGDDSMNRDIGGKEIHESHKNKRSTTENKTTDVVDKMKEVLKKKISEIGIDNENKIQQKQLTVSKTYKISAPLIVGKTIFDDTIIMENKTDKIKINKTKVDIDTTKTKEIPKIKKSTPKKIDKFSQIKNAKQGELIIAEKGDINEIDTSKAMNKRTLTIVNCDELEIHGKDRIYLEQDHRVDTKTKIPDGFNKFKATVEDKTDTKNKLDEDEDRNFGNNTEIDISTIKPYGNNNNQRTTTEKKTMNIDKEIVEYKDEISEKNDPSKTMILKKKSEICDSELILDIQDKVTNEIQQTNLTITSTGDNSGHSNNYEPIGSRSRVESPNTVNQITTASHSNLPQLPVTFRPLFKISRSRSQSGPNIAVTQRKDNPANCSRKEKDNVMINNDKEHIGHQHETEHISGITLLRSVTETVEKQTNNAVELTTREDNGGAALGSHSCPGSVTSRDEFSSGRGTPESDNFQSVIETYLNERMEDTCTIDKECDKDGTVSNNITSETCAGLDSTQHDNDYEDDEDITLIDLGLEKVVVDQPEASHIGVRDVDTLSHLTYCDDKVVLQPNEATNKKSNDIPMSPTSSETSSTKKRTPIKKFAERLQKPLQLLKTNNSNDEEQIMAVGNTKKRRRKTKKLSKSQITSDDESDDVDFPDPRLTPVKQTAEKVTESVTTEEALRKAKTNIKIPDAYRSPPYKSQPISSDLSASDIGMDIDSTPVGQTPLGDVVTPAASVKTIVTSGDNSVKHVNTEGITVPAVKTTNISSSIPDSTHIYTSPAQTVTLYGTTSFVSTSIDNNSCSRMFVPIVNPVYENISPVPSPVNENAQRVLSLPPPYEVALRNLNSQLASTSAIGGASDARAQDSHCPDGGTIDVMKARQNKVPNVSIKKALQSMEIPVMFQVLDSIPAIPGVSSESLCNTNKKPAIADENGDKMAMQLLYMNKLSKSSTVTVSLSESMPSTVSVPFTLSGSTTPTVVNSMLPTLSVTTTSTLSASTPPMVPGSTTPTVSESISFTVPVSSAPTLPRFTTSTLSVPAALTVSTTPTLSASTTHTLSVPMPSMGSVSTASMATMLLESSAPTVVSRHSTATTSGCSTTAASTSSTSTPSTRGSSDSFLPKSTAAACHCPDDFSIDELLKALRKKFGIHTTRESLGNMLLANKLKFEAFRAIHEELQQFDGNSSNSEVDRLKKENQKLHDRVLDLECRKRRLEERKKKEAG